MAIANPLFDAADDALSQRIIGGGWNGATVRTMKVNMLSTILGIYGKATRGADISNDLDTLLKHIDSRDLALAMVLAFQTRDIKSGKGERELFYTIMTKLVQQFPRTGKAVLDLVPEHGYYKDLCQLYKRWHGKGDVYDELADYCVQMFVDRLVVDYPKARTYLDAKVGPGNDIKLEPITLAYKWAPRLKSEFDVMAKDIAAKLPPALVDLIGGKGHHVRERTYRKILSTMSSACPTIEHLLCGVGDGTVPEEEVQARFANCGWIPSVALGRLKNALRGITKKGDARENLSALRQMISDLFQAHLDKAEKGEAKINARAAQPTDFAKFFTKGIYDQVMELQMTSFLNTIVGEVKNDDDEIKIDFGKCIALVDVSGSMSCSAGAGTGVTCMDIAIFLGYIVAKLADLTWRDRIITFDTNPKWFSIADCEEHYSAFTKIKSAPWGGSTDFEKALDLILLLALDTKLEQKDMPQFFFVFSDMQFDQARGANGYYGKAPANPWATVHEIMTKKWAAHNYKLPTMIYWNLNGNAPGFVVSEDTPGTIMVSGFSPSMLKLFFTGSNILAYENPTPMDLMMEDFNGTAYADVRQCIIDVQLQMSVEGIEPELYIPDCFPEAAASKPMGAADEWAFIDIV